MNHTHQENTTGVIRPVGVTSIESNNIASSNNIVYRESSLGEYSNFNFNPYSEFTGNGVEALSESAYLNRNFESHLDEIFDNLTYLITTEK